MVKSIFIGPYGVRAGWRFLAYVVLLVGLVIGIEFLLLPRVLAAIRYNEPGLTATGLIYQEIAEGICVFIATGILALCERRRIDAYGLPLRLAFGRLFWEGAAIGVIGAGGVALAMIAAGGMVVHGLALHGGVLLVTALLWLIGMVLVGINEEYMFRGYPLQALTRGMGFWPAAIVLSILFGAAHLTKPGENAIDITNIILLGLTLCLSLQRTGSLWLAVGFHFSFDFMQFFVIGTRNGGAVPVGHLLAVAFPGPAWVNGGALGTEASYFMLPTIALFSLYLLLRYPRAQALRT